MRQRRAKLNHVFGATRRDAVRKLRQTGGALEVNVLDLEVKTRPILSFEEKIDPAVLAIRDLPAHDRIIAKGRQRPGGEGLGNDAVGEQGIDPDQIALGLEKLQRIGKLALGVRGLRNPRSRAGLQQAEHRARIGAMGGNLAPVGEFDIGEEALVTPHKSGGQEGGREIHDAGKLSIAADYVYARGSSTLRLMNPAAKHPRSVVAAMLIIGNEVLSGRTRDANLQHFALKLATRGIVLGEARVIPDVPQIIVSAVNTLRAQYRYVFTTGGIGPTHDDITADCIAEAFGVRIGEDPRALAILERYYVNRDDFTSARRRMARIPAGADLIPNPVSGAPGFRIENVYVMAGVPRINQAMLDAVLDSLDEGTPRLAAALWGLVVEGRIADPLREIQTRAPDVEIGSYPNFIDGKFGTVLVLKSYDADALARAKNEVAAMLRAEGAEPREGEPPRMTAAGEPGS